MNFSKNDEQNFWDVRFKIITLFILVIGVISLQQPIFILIIMLILLLLAIALGLSLRLTISRTMLLLPFLALMILPILLGTGATGFSERYELALLIFLKALASFLAMLIMINTQTLQHLLDGLSSIKIPTVLISVLFLTYRYTLLYIDEIIKMKRALAARLFKNGVSRRALEVYGEISGGMMLKGIERSDILYRSMSSRGFNGKFPVGNMPKIRKRDYLISFVLLFFMLILIISDRWYLL